HLEPVDATTDDLLPRADALVLAANGDGPHPAFDAGTVDDVERDDLAALTAPHHRTVGGVANRIPPHRGIEEWNSYPNHAVAAITLRERFAEYLVQLFDFLEAGRVRPVEDVRRSPRT